LGEIVARSAGKWSSFWAQNIEARWMKMSRAKFESYVDQALAEIPASFAPYLQDVVIDVEPLPDRKACESVGITNPRHLLGLYRGIPLTGRHVEAPLQLPDRITLYQENIERICETHEALVQQIRKTVLHEIGHHFGLDEDDLAALGYG